MNRNHLTSEEMDALLHHHTTPETTQHLSTCSACTEELATLREVFGNLRQVSNAIAASSHEQMNSHEQINTHKQKLFNIHAAPPSRPRIAAWALAAAATVLIAIIPLTHHRAPVSQSPAPAAGIEHTANQVSDEALLNSIQDDLSTAVPNAMLPLAPSTQQSSGSTSQTPRKN